MSDEDGRSTWWEGTPPGRSARWEETHHRIAAVAVELFQDRGFLAVGIAQIAAAAGVSVPTFYAHYAGKEHVVLQLPTPEQTAALLAAQPHELPMGQRIRRMCVQAVTAMTGTEYEGVLAARWQVIASTPVLRHRTGEFERATAALVLQQLAVATGRPVSPADEVIAAAYLSAYTVGLLVWADSAGQRELLECIEESFDALDAG
ncbi:TetR family transcriptional regulator [Blastococcus sp. LR1]|uniref:TetR family transcriptional regulator n=1 Tax=Blastococcus sp. LR1 TaxID=2877000 RepID=UPI001CC9B943|nr:TetR family transcriptional regulator [Blastococcus sp. LR1]MCA0147013.1 TetR family transcriptional regulator [Blastococcus sp. LR1]